MLAAESLTSIRGGRVLFKDLSFSLKAGEALLVAGPNGSGKTTLLRIIAGLLAPFSGHVGLSDGKASLAESVHFVGHLDAMKGALSLRENLAFYRRLFDGSGDEDNALARLGVGELAPLPVDALSAGQRRRGALSRLLVAKRPIWLLDEPGTSLDSDGQRLLGHVMDEHRAGGGMVIAATHAALDLAGARELRLGAIH
jgi:heme exporter protein A